MIRLGYIVVTRQYLDIQGAELERVARSLAATVAFANPFSIPTGPTAHPAPGYTFLLGGVYALLGNTVAAEACKQVLAALVSAATYALLPFVAVACGFAQNIGIWAGLVGALLPFRLINETKGNVEAPYTAALLILISILTVRLWRERELGAGLAVIYGLLWGLGMFFAPTFLPVLCAVFIVSAYLFRGGERRAFARFAVIALGCVVLVLSPWMVRNTLRLGSPVWGRDNFGLEFDLSNYDGASPRMDENKDSGHHGRLHPLYSVDEALKVREMGEVAYNRQRLATAIAWAKGHPGEFARLTLLRGWYFWLPVSRPRIKDPVVWGITVLAFLGLWRMYASHREAALVFTALWVAFPLVYYLIQAVPRYRYPIDWTFLILAVFGAYSFIHNSGNGRHDHTVHG